MFSFLVTSLSTEVPFEWPSTWWQWMLWIFGTVGGVLVAIVAVRFTVSLDLNSVLKARRERQISRIQNACTHLMIEHDGKETLTITDCFYSPPGTLIHQCSRCQLTSWNPERDYPGRADYYLAHIDEYLEAEKKFSKLLRKAGYTN